MVDLVLFLVEFFITVNKLVFRIQLVELFYLVCIWNVENFMIMSHSISLYIRDQ